MSVCVYVFSFLFFFQVSNSIKFVTTKDLFTVQNKKKNMIFHYTVYN